MFKNNKISKLLCIIVSFTLFFSLFNISYADDASTIEKEQPMIMQALTKVLLALGDGVVHLVSASVGETITIDRLVFNDVQKVSIDYFDDIKGDDNEHATQEPIKAFMEDTVEKWYAIFFKIATMAYMVVLVYIGISILLASTAEKKSSYKQLFSTWCIGIAILFLFPYIMKYVILINNSLVKTLQAHNGFQEPRRAESLSGKNFIEVAPFYATEEFIDILIGLPEGEKAIDSEINDMMVVTRKAAQVPEKNDSKEEYGGDFTLGIVYLIVIGQMIAILIMYYKRAFMIAFLITIFPLVAMTYVLDKIRRW